MSPAGATSLASLDGEIMPVGEAMIPATDEGLIRGDGIFEVIRVYDGRPFALDDHLERLARSGANLRLAVDVEAVRADAFRLLAEVGAGPDHDCLRVVLTRGGCRLLMTERLPPNGDTVRLATITFSPTRILDGIKSLSYGSNMLATRLAREQGADEALLITPHGRVLEAPTSSIFWVSGSEVLTPPLSDHILASITRRVVIEESGAQEQPCTMEDLAAADEAFLASTTREVQPISAIDEISFDGTGEVVARIASAVSARIRSELDG